MMFVTKHALPHLHVHDECQSEGSPTRTSEDVNQFGYLLPTQLLPVVKGLCNAVLYTLVNSFNYGSAISNHIIPHNTPSQQVFKLGFPSLIRKVKYSPHNFPLNALFRMVSQSAKALSPDKSPALLRNSVKCCYPSPLLRVRSDKLPLIHQRHFFIETKIMQWTKRKKQALQPQIQCSCTNINSIKMHIYEGEIYH